MSEALRNHLAKNSGQRAPIPGREKDMIKNDAGGYSFKVPPIDFLRRFLILGTDGGTYYANEAAHTERAVNGVLAAIEKLGPIAVKEIAEISSAGRAPKVSPAIMALAVAFAKGSLEVKKDVVRQIRKKSVLRTNAHMLEFVSYVLQMRGTGRLFREAVGGFYKNADVDWLAYQAVKYRNRSGITTADVLRLTHPKPEDETMSTLMKWITLDQKRNRDSEVSGFDSEFLESVPDLIYGYEQIRSCTDPQEACKLIEKYAMTHEMVPSELQKNPQVWGQLAMAAPPHALIRNLGRMQANGALDIPEVVSRVLTVLHNSEYLIKSRVHPMSVLLAMSTYAAGQGVKGSLRWDPNPAITAALETAFYGTFPAVEPTGKKILYALDVSASMGQKALGTHLSCFQAEVAIVMAQLRAERQGEVIGFSNAVRPLPELRVDAPLESNVRRMSRLPFGGTNCSAALEWATRENKDFDAVVVITDNENWSGGTHVTHALTRYQDKVGRDVRFIQSAMTASHSTIGDPKRTDMLETVGLDAALPKLMADFIGGRF